MTTVAFALADLGKHRQAVAALPSVEQATSRWIRAQSYPQTVLEQRSDSSPRPRQPDQRELATRIGVPI